MLKPFYVDLLTFVKESYKIEGESTPSSVPFVEIEEFLKTSLTEKSLKNLHNILSKGRDILSGNYRNCNVVVGGYYPPVYQKIPKLMKEYFKKLSELDSFEAHNKFELIHPFEDLNGRMGRFIWLHKSLNADEYAFQISFLHKYYYQCLNHQSKSTPI